MGDILLFSFEAVFPLVVLLVIGYALKSAGLIDANMLDKSNHLVFRLFLPVKIFYDITQMDIAQEFDLKLLIYAAGCVMATILLMWLLIPRFVKRRGQVGTIIQAIYRGNYVIYAIPLATNMFAEKGLGPTSMILPVVMILFNVFGVVILSIFSEKRDTSLPIASGLKKTFIEILKNPLILGSLAGILYSLSGLPMPSLLSKLTGQIGGVGPVLALLLLGAQFDWNKAKGNMKMSMTVALTRMVVMPAILLAFCILVGGFRGPQLGALFSLFAAPTAVNSYVMAKNMHNDADLAGQLVILTTLMSSATIFIGIALLRGVGVL